MMQIESEKEQQKCFWILPQSIPGLGHMGRTCNRRIIDTKSQGGAGEKGYVGPEARCYDWLGAETLMAALFLGGTALRYEVEPPRAPENGTLHLIVS